MFLNMSSFKLNCNKENNTMVSSALLNNGYLSAIVLNSHTEFFLCAFKF
jgi:hypothetical protein